MAVAGIARSTWQARSGPGKRDWAGLVALGVPLFVAALTLEQARWVVALPPLPLVVAAALAQGPLLLWRGHGGPRAHALGFSAGLVAGLAVAFLTLAGSPLIGVGAFFVAIIWWATYASLWLAFARRSARLAVLPGLAVLLVALAFLPSDFHMRLPWYLVAAALPLGYFRLREWSDEGRQPRLLPMGLAVVLAVLALAPAAVVPWPGQVVRLSGTTALQDRLYTVWEQASTVFASVPNRREWPKIIFSPELPITGPLELTEDVLMLVDSTEPRKIRLSVYETYNSRGWTSALVTGDPAPASPDVSSDQPGLRARENVTISIRAFSTLHQVPTAGIPMSSNAASLVQQVQAAEFEVALAGRQGATLPPDVDDVAGTIRLLSRIDQQGVATALAFRGLEVAGPGANGDSLTLRRVDEPNPNVSLAFAEKLVPPRSYETVGSVSTASPGDLRVAVGDYPTHVTDRYLQLPDSFPRSIRKLAVELASGSDNAYDIAVALEAYLSSLRYSTEIVAPPPGYDAVEWFIVEQHVGFCQYFASAMATMLRSLGIPARLVVGFAPGEWDSERDVWVVRAENYHAWPEVYFPGYGWVEFEPTPADVQPSLASFQTHLAGRATAASQPVDNTALDEECADLADLCEDDPSGAATPIAPIPAQPGFGLSSWPLWLLAALGVAGAMVLRSRRAGRPRSRPGSPERAFASVSFFAALAGVPRLPHETATEFESRLVQRLPAKASAVHRLVDTYRRTKYGQRKRLTLAEQDAMHRAARSLRWALVRLALRRIVPSRPRRTATAL